MRNAAAGKDVRIGGGANTIRQYLRERLIDELHIAISPVLLGRGEPLFEGIDLRALGYECVQSVASEKAAHIVLRKGRRKAGAWNVHVDLVAHTCRLTSSRKPHLDSAEGGISREFVELTVACEVVDARPGNFVATFSAVPGR